MTLIVIFSTVIRSITVRFSVSNGSDQSSGPEKPAPNLTCSIHGPANFGNTPDFGEDYKLVSSGGQLAVVLGD